MLYLNLFLVAPLASLAWLFLLQRAELKRLALRNEALAEKQEHMKNTVNRWRADFLDASWKLKKRERQVAILWKAKYGEFPKWAVEKSLVKG